MSYELVALNPPVSVTVEGMASTLCINNKGFVAGSVGDISNNVAFLFDGVRIDIIDALRPLKAVVQDINDFNCIVGHVSFGYPNKIQTKSFFLCEDDLQILNDGDGDNYAVAINNVGHSLVLHEGWHSSIYKDKTLHLLDPLGKYRLQAKSMNDYDHVVGVGNLNNQKPRSGGAFLCKNGDISFVPKLMLGDRNEQMSVANAVNNTGGVVGFSGTIKGLRYAFQYHHNVLYNLGTLDSWWSNALALNNNGDVVGYCKPPHLGISHAKAILWRDQKLIVLNEYVQGMDWDLKIAVDINDKGQIVGWGLFRGIPQIFLMNFL